MTRAAEDSPQDFQEEPTRLFAIVSWGAAATHWLSKVLNAHPEVLCLHNPADSWLRLTGTPRIDDVTYMKIVADAGRGYRAAGDCHGVWASSIPRMRAKWGDRFRAAAVVRHPIPRIASLWSLANKTGFHHYKLDYRFLREVAPRELAWIETEEHLFFLHAARMPNNVLDEVQVGPLYRMETLTADRNEVRGLLRHISGGELDFDPGTLDRVFDRTVMSHAGREQAQRPREAFERFAGWQREILAAALDPAARAIYERLGYDLGFL